MDGILALVETGLIWLFDTRMQRIYPIHGDDLGAVTFDADTLGKVLCAL